jgi:arylsulfatase
VVGDIIHVSDPYTTFARLGGSKGHTPNWICGGDVAASGMPEAYHDLYMDPREENPRPETLAIADRVRAIIDAMPFGVEEYTEYEIPGSDDVGDWGE